MSLQEIAAAACFLISCIFGIAGLAGMFRFSDPYSRLQAGALCGTTSVFSVFIGALLLSPNTAVTARIIIIAVFFLISAPTGSHIVARFAWNAGHISQKPSRKKRPKGREQRS